MKRFFGSNFFIGLLIVAIILVTVPSVLSFMGFSGYVRNAFGVVLTTLQHPVTFVADAIDGYRMYFREFDRLRDENIQLREKLLALEDKIYNAQLLEEENNWLRTYLSLQREHTDYQLEPATVVGREAGNYMTVFTINRGSLHNIKVNMPVITPEGIVGYVAEVGLTWSKVSTLIDTATAVGAYIERSGALGLVEGEYSLRDQGLCKLDYLDPEVDISVGDRVLSSGLGSVYPRGLLIGKIVEIIPNAYSRNLIAIIKTEVDLESLSQVMIIKSFDVYVE
ncbi:MAG: rod shape-determining protein MreC [Clostridiales bacterium]|nr:rod shape-determining protein MreC [Clostridiales bacterium]